MAIAGIEPVGYTNDKMMGPGEESNTNIVTGELLSIDLPQGIPLFTEKQVREILIKYREQLSPEYDQYGNRWIENDDVDKFMESDGGRCIRYRFTETARKPKAPSSKSTVKRLRD